MTDDDQIGGHGADAQGRKRIVYGKQKYNGKVFKLYDETDLRAKRELDFYNDVKNNNEDMFGTIIPHFYELLENSVPKKVDFELTESEEKDGAPGDYLVMENINNKLNQYSSHLCVADLKIGEPTKTGLKKEILFPGLDDWGLYPAGLKYRTNSSKNYSWAKTDKTFGMKNFTLGSAAAIFELFLQGTDEVKLNSSTSGFSGLYKKKIITDFLAELTKIEEFFQTQTRYQFLGSSLIFSYLPSAFIADDFDENSEILKNLVNDDSPILINSRLIDFNNVKNFREEGNNEDFKSDAEIGKIDEQCLKGIQNIKSLLEEQIPAQSSTSAVHFKKFSNIALSLKITGQNLINMDTGNKEDGRPNLTDAYYTIKQNNEEIYTSEVVNDNLNPNWKPVQLICKNDVFKNQNNFFLNQNQKKEFDSSSSMIVEVWDKDKKSIFNVRGKELIGKIEVNDVFEFEAAELINEKLKGEAPGGLVINKSETKFCPLYLAVSE